MELCGKYARMEPKQQQSDSLTDLLETGLDCNKTDFFFQFFLLLTIYFNFLKKKKLDTFILISAVVA